MQNHYSLLYREEEREMFPTLKVVFALKLRVHLTLTSFQDVRGRVDPLVSSGPRNAHTHRSRCHFPWQDRWILVYLRYTLLGRPDIQV